MVESVGSAACAAELGMAQAAAAGSTRAADPISPA
jgi:hypothetical protein